MMDVVFIALAILLSLTLSFAIAKIGLMSLFSAIAKDRE